MVWVVAITVVAVAAIAGSSHVRARRVNHAQPFITASSQVPAVSAAQRGRVRANLDALPLAFEANQGQTDPQVKYMARGNGYKLFLTSSKAIMTLPGGRRPSEVMDVMMNKRRGAAGVKAMLKKRAGTHRQASPSAVLQMNFLGPNTNPQLVAEERQPGKINYFIGKDRSQWHSNIPLYGRVSYRNVYPGIDLAFHGAAKQLEFDYLVSPGADAKTIALSFEGAESMHTNEAGDLILATTAGPVELHKPVAYQSKGGARETVNARFVLTSNNKVTFELGAYDRNREVVIDPTVSFSTYFGGGGGDYGTGVAVDAASGDAFVTGATDSASIPGNSGGTVGFDAYVTEITPAGSLVFTAIFGGGADDFPGGIALDSTGIYVAGTTDSNDFPVTGGAAQTTFLGGALGGTNDAFAVKLALNGSVITWGTYIAGSNSDSGLGVAVDGAHNVYVVGETFSNDLGGVGGGINALPSGTAVNLGTGTGPDDGYIAILNSTGTAYSMVSYIGGSSNDLATGVALDGSGNIYVSGETISADLPTGLTPGVLQPKCGTNGNCNANGTSSFDDAFVVSIKANLLGYNYLTYYGGSDVDDALAIAVDASGDAFITGTTASLDLLSSGTTFQSKLLGTKNAFISELNSAGTAIAYNTYFGGDGTDLGLGITLDGADNVYLTGQSSSSSASFPLLNATQSVGNGSTDAFVSVLGISQGQLLFSTLLGGGGDEDQFQGAIGLDPLTDDIYVTGDTDSGNGSTAAFPTTAGPIGTTYGGGTCKDSVGNSVPCTDAFVTAFSPANVPDFTLSATALSPASVAPGGSATSTLTITPLNGYTGTVNLTCAVTGSGSPLPACSLNSSTITVTTTGASAALDRPSGIFYAMWLPVVGLSLVGMSFSGAGSRRKKLAGFFLLGLMMAALFFLPGCGGSSSPPPPPPGCSGCTPAGNYTVTVTGTDSVHANLTHDLAPPLTLTVN
jgi:hypothetical protein